jgi:putative transposase
VRFAFIATEKACFPVALMCRMLGVSRAGFYAWPRRPLAARTRQNQVLAVAVAAIYTEHHGHYGSPCSWNCVITASAAGTSGSPG